ncbi:MAG: FAD-dependent oxidoreductase, partial [Methylicorpusculum sp.]|nr:FAD-dependent oxidoreductase [Methylicorpusculum sp.]
MTDTNEGRHKIVIVGGGAGGLELATRLGQKLGKKGLAEIYLIDASSTHIWKPLLHEVAAGTLDETEQVEYLAQAHRNGFRFRLGRMESLNREKK